jgi:hypothetical protein
MQRVWYRPQSLTQTATSIPSNVIQMPQSQPNNSSPLGGVPSYEELAAEASKRPPK